MDCERKGAWACIYIVPFWEYRSIVNELGGYMHKYLKSILRSIVGTTLELEKQTDDWFISG